MFEFINYLRVIATGLITNSHYSNIWPIDILSSGGLLGNLIFLSVSGFLLFNVQIGFKKWYIKRFLRIYPTLFGFTLFTVLVGEYPLNNIDDAVKLFIYPTNYIFIFWLFICYVLFYIIAYMDKKYTNVLEISMLVIFALWIFTYVAFCDKTFYSVDRVYKPFILFMYMECMLMGAYFRKHKEKFIKFSFTKVISAIVCLALYFITKVAVSRMEVLLNFQIINQFVIIIALFTVFNLFLGLEQHLKKMPKIISQMVGFISNITLQVYFVQFVVIMRCEKLPFPASLISVVVGIFVAATILYYVEQLIRKGIDSIKKSRKCNLDAESTNQKN